MTDIVWGSTSSINPLAKRNKVSMEAEIGKGNLLYISTPKIDNYANRGDVVELENGNISFIKEDIERMVPGSQVIWMKASYDGIIAGVFNSVVIQGLQYQAVIKNVNAGLTGLEIVVILGAVAFLAAITTAAILASWLVYEIVNSTQQAAGDWGVIVVGLVILVFIGAGVYLLFGGRIKGKGKKGSFQLGK